MNALISDIRFAWRQALSKPLFAALVVGVLALGIGATICMATHDPRYADYAERQIHMFDGRIVDEEILAPLRAKEDRRIAEQAKRGGG